MLLRLPLQASLQLPLLATPVICTSASPHHMLVLKHTASKSKACVYLLFMCVHACVSFLHYHRGQERKDLLELE